MTNAVSSYPCEFLSLPLQPFLLKNLQDLSCERLTQIQAAALPAIVDIKNVIRLAETGSGKTVAFRLRLLQKLRAERFQVKPLVSCPTRGYAMNKSSFSY